MANIATYAKKAKAIRRNHPNMTWQNAMKAAARGGGVSRTRRASKPAARRRVSGSVGSTAAVGSKGHRRRRSVGATGTAGMVKQIIPMAVGMGLGVGFQHFVLRPAEAWI